jgi:hypothetical protein
VDERLRRVLASQAPALRQAVIDSFTFDADDLRRMARCQGGDSAFPSRYIERQRQRRCLPIHSRGAVVCCHGALGVHGVPHHQTRRFVSVSDKDEYPDLVQDFDGTSAWYFTPQERHRGQFSGGIRRWSSSPSTAVTAQRGHLLYIDIEQPTRGIEVELDYGDCDVERVTVLDLIASSRATRIVRTPESVPGRSVRVSFHGWAFPRSGFRVRLGGSGTRSALRKLAQPCP